MCGDASSVRNYLERGPELDVFSINVLFACSFWGSLFNFDLLFCLCLCPLLVRGDPRQEPLNKTLLVNPYLERPQGLPN